MRGRLLPVVLIGAFVLAAGLNELIANDSLRVLSLAVVAVIMIIITVIVGR